ncbi:PTS sugar transporter subunit IIB [Massilimicrobiota timonensis]|uniref:PTS sugar transporter subunit IIB n=1 Tax=Massilimicrobiota timonensis TaxID=1776392 RepID=A0ABT7UH40_9FIRM|nr:PTS sugar transporter subunit IIB [Massilimicrobiota timonensis]MDM8195460.1 PTS sugar transporter subunit IIB [Massilimicrobiota timonensis]
MKKILLACNAGMSTSLLVSNMQKYAKEIGVEVMIEAMPVLQAEKSWQDWDIILLGPQVRHVIGKFKETVKEQIPVLVIDMRDYGLMNGKNVLNTALKALEE